MTYILIFVAGLIALMVTGIHVATAIYLIGWFGDFAEAGLLRQMGGTVAWNTVTEFLLVAIPLFILVGEVLLRSGLADKMYTALAVWTRRIPGGLLHTNIAACALFSATSGSSVATAATIGTVAMPSLRERGYSESLTLGSIAAGGTLGILIPPSINMIIYGALTGASIGRLFAAGIVPGILLAITMSAIICFIAVVRPRIAGRPELRSTVGERMRRLIDLVPAIIIFAVIMGSIYSGLATPTEAGALALITVLLLSAWSGKLTIAMLHDAFRATVRTTAMVMLILVAAFTLNFIIGFLGIPQQLSAVVADLGLSPYAMIWLLVLFYLILGCFLEAVSMMVTTIAIVAPLVESLGFDLVWFGIFMTIMMELALITPPVGLNLYVVQSIRDKGGSIYDVFIGVFPFVVAMLLVITLLIYFPQIALWLPDKMFG